MRTGESLHSEAVLTCVTLVVSCHPCNLFSLVPGLSPLDKKGKQGLGQMEVIYLSLA